MNDQERTPKYGSPDGLHPHVPGHDPMGSGLPRQPESPTAPSSASAETGPVDEDALADEDAPVDEDALADADAPADEDAPLGGDENTEGQLTADTAVERDALKSLDPDDTPA
jgi:hypothetical protein